MESGGALLGSLDMPLACVAGLDQAVVAPPGCVAVEVGDGSSVIVHFGGQVVLVAEGVVRFKGDSGG